MSDWNCHENSFHSILLTFQCQLQPVCEIHRELVKCEVEVVIYKLLKRKISYYSYLLQFTCSSVAVSSLAETEVTFMNARGMIRRTNSGGNERMFEMEKRAVMK